MKLIEDINNGIIKEEGISFKELPNDIQKTLKKLMVHNKILQIVKTNDTWQIKIKSFWFDKTDMKTLLSNNNFATFSKMFSDAREIDLSFII